MIDESQLSPAHNIWSTTKLKIQRTNQALHNNRPKWLLSQASSYLSIGHSNVTSLHIAEIGTHSPFKQISFNMKIAKKKIRMQTPLVNPIINLERPLKWLRILWDQPPLLWRRIIWGVAYPERQTTQGLRWPKHQSGAVKAHICWTLITRWCPMLKIGWRKTCLF